MLPVGTGNRSESNELHRLVPHFAVSLCLARIEDGLSPFKKHQSVVQGRCNLRVVTSSFRARSDTGNVVLRYMKVLGWLKFWCSTPNSCQTVLKNVTGSDILLKSSFERLIYQLYFHFRMTQRYWKLCPWMYEAETEVRFCLCTPDFLSNHFEFCDTILRIALDRHAQEGPVCGHAEIRKCA